MESSPETARPTAKDIAAKIRADIASGELGPGDRLPTGRDLAKQNRVTLMTVQNAYRLLRDEGIVISQQGRGTFVRDPSESDGDGGSPAYTALAADLSAIHETLRQLGARLERLERLVEGEGPKAAP